MTKLKKVDIIYIDLVTNVTVVSTIFVQLLYQFSWNSLILINEIKCLLMFNFLKHVDMIIDLEFTYL